MTINKRETNLDFFSEINECGWLRGYFKNSIKNIFKNFIESIFHNDILDMNINSQGPAKFVIRLYMMLNYLLQYRVKLKKT